MEEGDDRDEQEESAEEITSTYGELVLKAQVGIGTLGVLLEQYGDFMQMEKEERERQDQKERKEKEWKLKRQKMERKHMEVTDRLKIAQRNRII